MDHEVVNVRESGMSCGVMELSRINEDTDRVLYALASRLYHPSRGAPCAYFIFSDINTDDGDTASDRLHHQATQLKFGAFVITEGVENPRTGNDIVVFVWAINHSNFKDWYAKRRVEKLGKVGA